MPFYQNIGRYYIMENFSEGKTYISKTPYGDFVFTIVKIEDGYVEYLTPNNPDIQITYTDSILFLNTMVNAIEIKG